MSIRAIPDKSRICHICKVSIALPLKTQAMKSKRTIQWIVLFLILGCLIYVYRLDFYDRYGKRFNQERAQLGVLEIPEDWISTHNGTQTKLWKSKEINEVKKGRLGKEVLVNKDKEIYLERDRIINRANGVYKGLEVSYEYDKEPGFSYRYFEIEGNTQVNKRQLTQLEFEEIIKDWDIHLNE